MSAEVLLQGLREQRRVLIGWSLGWAGLIGLYCASWPAVRDNGSRYDEIAADLPAALRQVIAGPGGELSLGTPAGYLRSELLSATGPLLAVVLGLLLGSWTIAGDEDRGTLELLLAQPVSRRRVLLEQFAAAAAGLLSVFAVMTAALVVFGSFVDLGTPLWTLVAVGVVLALLALQAAAVALVVGAATGKVGLARGAAGIVAVIAFLIQALQESVPVLADLAWASPFHLVAEADPLTKGLSAVLLLQLLVPVAALAALAVRLFDRRDVAHA